MSTGELTIVLIAHRCACEYEGLFVSVSRLACTPTVAHSQLGLALVDKSYRQWMAVCFFFLNTLQIEVARVAFHLLMDAQPSIINTIYLSSTQGIETNPADFRQEASYTLGRSAIYHKASTETNHPEKQSLLV